MDVNEWRFGLQPDSRRRIVNKIFGTFQRHFLISSPETFDELKDIAEKFEEKVYAAAISQADYLRKISLKMLTLETKSQETGVTKLLPSYSVRGKKLPPCPEISTNMVPPQQVLQLSNAMDKCILNNLVAQIRLGQSVGKTFRHKAIEEITVDLNRKFDLNLKNDWVLNRVRYLKKLFEMWTHLLKNIEFKWDGSKKMLIASDAVWSGLLQREPQYAHLRGQTIDCPDELFAVFNK